MKQFLLLLLFILCILQYSVHSQRLQTCTGSILRFPPPSQGQCLTSWSGQRGEKKVYPDDFQGILNEVEIYQCPSRNKRVIISNGIPNHVVTLQNRIGPCEINWAVELPLNPTVADERTEVPIRGMIAMAMNGVPAYGPQESDYHNAVEGTLGVPGARFWYGHAGPNSVWHIHNPKMGRELESHETLMGYAMDGFPIYGHLDDDSSLDPCNGVYKDGKYQYHVRTLEQVDDSLEYCNSNSPETNNWPYILGCYSGSVESTQVFDSSSYSLDEDCVIDDDLPPLDTATLTTATAATQQSTPIDSSKSDNNTPPKQPNVIMMQPDDFPFYDTWGKPPDNPSNANKDYILPSYGLPNIESLRLNGVQMLQAYTSSAMCGTSRFSTMTSRYPSRALSNDDDVIPSNVIIPSTKLEGNDCASDNIAVQFRDNGYRTAMIGKWHLSYIDDSTYSYESAVSTVKQCGFDTVEGLYMENLASEDINNYSHNMEWVTSEAIQVIEENSDKPFFMYFNPTVLHQSNSISDALNEFSCRDTAAGILDQDPEIPDMTDDGDCASYRQTIFERAGEEDDLGAIWIDDSVGAVLRSLKDTGKLDDTIFLFQADHGINPKGAIYEGGVRIPQFIHYPAMITAGTQFNLPVSVVVGPTMLDFAGITPSYDMDGKSWKDAVANDDSMINWEDRCLFFELQRDRSVRCGCYKYLSIYSENGASSTTSIRGERMGLSNDERNLFDLCGSSDNGSNMEVMNLIDSEPNKASDFEELLECHTKRTQAADFSQCQLSTPTTGNISINGPDITNNPKVSPSPSPMTTEAPMKSSNTPVMQPTSPSPSLSSSEEPTENPSLSPQAVDPDSMSPSEKPSFKTSFVTTSEPAIEGSTSTAATQSSSFWNSATKATTTFTTASSTSTTSKLSDDKGGQYTTSTKATSKSETLNTSTKMPGTSLPNSTDLETVELVLDPTNGQTSLRPQMGFPPFMCVVAATLCCIHMFTL